MGQSNLSEIRDMSKVLFNAVPIQSVDYGLLIHPYLNHIADVEQKNGELIVLDLSTEKGRIASRKKWMKLFDESDLCRLYTYVRTAWKLTWFKYVNKFLSEEDFAHYLEDAWITEENPNQDVNVSRKESIGYFRKANKKYLMCEEDYEYYKNLPEEITIWRGVSPGREKYGLSWTDDKDKAVWFQERFKNWNEGEGELLKAVVNKKDVLAYFNTRGEKELVMDVFKIKKNIVNVTEV